MKTQIMSSLIVLCLVFIGCTDEQTSPGEKMTDLMAKVVKEKNVRKARAYEMTANGYALTQFDSDFKLDGNYIVFLPDPGPDGIIRYYNADKVNSFEVYNGILFVYFN